MYEFIEEDELDAEGSAEHKEANRRRIELSMNFLWHLRFEFASSVRLDN